MGFAGLLLSSSWSFGGQESTGDMGEGSPASKPAAWSVRRPHNLVASGQPCCGGVGGEVDDG